MHFFKYFIISLALSVLLPGMVAIAQTATYGSGAFSGDKYGGASATPSTVPPSLTGGGVSATELLNPQSTTSPATTSPLSTATTTETGTASATPAGIGATTTLSTLAASSPPFTKNLGIGMKNEDVKTLQKLLSQYPDFYPDKYVTGYFGSATKEAVIKFQAKYNLPQTGFVGSLTIKKLNELAKTAPKQKLIEKSVKSADDIKNDNAIKITCIRHYSGCRIFQKRLKSCKITCSANFKK